jgi:2-C-methyl-D-erythritol 4-phosphate cytidylyltransferase/2-C-methyl-D-erythritol 2,4-cyclodiphosphate synthase
MTMVESVWAVIPAAGLGVRAGGRMPKQFVEIAGKTILEWTADKVMSMPEVDGAVIVLPHGYEGQELVQRTVQSLTSRHGKSLVTATGGPTRQESVRLALEKIPPQVSWVIVHDASRPLFSRNLAVRVLEAAKRHSAAVCGIGLTDTVKAVIPSGHEELWFVHSTLSRDGIVLVQTPQVFGLSLLRQCHEMARRDGFIGTDDGQLVERFGHKLAIVKGERTNFKVTFPEDFEMLSMILEKQGNDLESAGRETPIEEGGPASFRFRQSKAHRRLSRRYDTSVQVTGFGFDVHPMACGRKCVLGGVEVPSPKGLVGHSDADVLCHAVVDAVLGALSMGDIGKWFPPEDPRFRDARSLDLLADIWSNAGQISEIVHLDCTLVAQEPRLFPYIEHMRRNISQALSVPVDRISIKATSPENLGSLGRSEGIAAFCVATLLKKGRV